MVFVMRHSYGNGVSRKQRATGLPHLSPRRHSLTLPADRASGASSIGDSLHLSEVLKWCKHCKLGVAGERRPLGVVVLLSKFVNGSGMNKKQNPAERMSETLFDAFANPDI